MILHVRFSYWMVSDLFLAAGEIPLNFFNLPANRFLRPLQWRHTNTNATVGNTMWQRSFTNAAECKYEFAQVFYDIKWISSWTFEFEKKTQKKTIPKNPGTQMLNVMNQLQHFILWCAMEQRKTILTVSIGLGYYYFSVLHISSYLTQWSVIIV